MVTFLIVFASLIGINALLLFLSNSLVHKKLQSGAFKKSEAAQPQVYSLSSADSKYRNAV